MMLLSVLLSMFAATLCHPSLNSTTSTMPDSVAPSTSTAASQVELFWLNSTGVKVNRTTRIPTSTERMSSSTPLFSTSPRNETAEAKLLNNTEAHNTTFPLDVEKEDLMQNPGLVTVICMFCILLVLMLFVGTVKCLQMPKSSFERLEEVPLSKVTEDSPFPHYSK